MPDNLSKKKPQDASRINIHEDWELIYWCAELDCTQSELIAAVKAVGTSTAKVKAYLNK